YQKIIDKVIDFFEGRDEELIAETEKKMKDSAEKKNFEKAAYYRDQLFAMKKLQELKLTALQIQKRSEKEFTRKGLMQIKQKLGLSRIPRRIEIYDISNIQGKYAVGSMVVFTNGMADKSQYRKFKIKTIQGVNDTAMLREVVMRRVKHDEWAKPDLAIMDGGKGQLNAVKDVWESIDVNVCALAKQEEEFFFAE
ncbi:MAG: UvrB/UvrC motif-containing protein, partial [Patescibacteria group bacterium]